MQNVNRVPTIQYDDIHLETDPPPLLYATSSVFVFVSRLRIARVGEIVLFYRTNRKRLVPVCEQLKLRRFSIIK